MKHSHILNYKNTLYYLCLLVVLVVSSCTTKPKSDVDTPEYHYKAGMRQIEMNQYSDALTSFQRAVDLDKKFVPGYGGLGLAHAPGKYEGC